MTGADDKQLAMAQADLNDAVARLVRLAADERVRRAYEQGRRAGQAAAFERASERVDRAVYRRGYQAGYQAARRGDPAAPEGCATGRPRATTAPQVASAA